MEIAQAVDTFGYLHVPAFLQPSELDNLRGLYNQLRARPGRHGATESLVHREVTDRIDGAVLGRLHGLCCECLPGHDFLPTDGLFFRVSPGGGPSVNYPFHQDHESYFVYQDHRRYFNCFLVLDKELPQHANITVVPLHALRNADPKLYEIVVGSGATTFGRGELLNGDVGSRHNYALDLDSIAVTPSLRAGDLLLLRGDTIHRTQNQRGYRLALSLRWIYKGAVANRRNWTKLSMYKAEVLRDNVAYYARYDYLFAKRGTDYLTAEEIVAEWPPMPGSGGQPPGFARYAIWFGIRAYSRWMLCKAFSIGTRRIGASAVRV